MERLKNWKRPLGIYLLWATAHLSIFLLNTPKDTAKPYFWPIIAREYPRDSIFASYDATELGIYLLIPVVLFVSIKLIFSKPNK